MLKSAITQFTPARRLKTLLALGGMAVLLSGCVVYPNGGYYNNGYGYAPSYYAAPPITFGFGYYGGYGHRWR